MNSLRSEFRRVSNLDCLNYEEFDLKYNTDTSHPTRIAYDGLVMPDCIPFDTPGNYPYQNTLISSIETMNSYFSAVPKIRDYTFLDLGSGKGRVILASIAQNASYGAYKGLEVEETLWAVAQENLNKTNIGINTKVEFILGDIREYICKADPTIYFFFNPVSQEVFDQFMQNNWETISKSPAFLVFHLNQYDISKYINYKPLLDDNYITIYSSQPE